MVFWKLLLFKLELLSLLLGPFLKNFAIFIITSGHTDQTEQSTYVVDNLNISFLDVLRSIQTKIPPSRAFTVGIQVNRLHIAFTYLTIIYTFT